VGLAAAAPQGDGEMDGRRWLRHLLTPRWWAHRALRQDDLQAIEMAIAMVEKDHRGELRFVIEGPLPLHSLWKNVSVRARAAQVFAMTGVWDTEDNCGILIYVQLVDRRVEILADRGIAQAVPQNEWDAICRTMEDAFRVGNYRDGALAAINQAGELLARHFPADLANEPAVNNELDNQPLRI
jgi:uncharacterized membrane protein